MAANTVIVKVNDKTKGLRFAETLTTGSVYGVTLDGATVATGTLALIAETPEGPKLVACAELADSAGTLSTNTAEMADVVGRLPIGTAFQLKAVVHRSDAGEAENVAVGTCALVSAGGAWTDDTTGALVLYKGQKGDDGAPGPQGESAYEIAVRHGFEGTETQWLATLQPKVFELYAVRDYSATNKWYNIEVQTVTLPDGTTRKTLAVSQTSTEENATRLTPIFSGSSPYLVTLEVHPILWPQENSGIVPSTKWVRSLMVRAHKTGIINPGENGTFATAEFSSANDNALVPGARYRCTFTYTACGNVSGGQTVEIKTSGDGTNAPYAPVAHGGSGRLYRHVRFATADENGALTLYVKTSDKSQVAAFLYDLDLA